MAENVVGHAILSVEADADGVKAGLAEGARALDAFGNKAKQVGQEAAVGFGASGTAAEETARKLTKSQLSIVESIKRQSIATTEGKSALLEYKAAQAGVTGEVAPYIAKLREAEQANKKFGVSAAQTANAWRMVPMQATDAFTQLAGGQNPLLIMIQQGGQMKDSFGGIGPMLSAMAGAITPVGAAVTGVAAALAGLGYAYYAGSQEADAFNESLAMTNGYVGMSISQMAAMAARIGDTIGTQGQAAEALAEIAGSGKIAGAEIEHIATAAVLMERATGKAVKDTVKEFSSLADGPAAASLKLNETYHYLTASVYEQIVALEKQGDTQAAVELAQKTFADANEKMANRVVENLGYLEKGWVGVKDAIAGAWDAMKNFGRDKSLDVQLQDINKKIQDANVGLANAKTPSAKRGNQEMLDDLTKQRDAILSVKEVMDVSMATQKTNQEIQEKGLSAEKAIEKVHTEALSNAGKRNKALEDYRKNLDAIRKANPNSALLDPKRIAQDEANIREKFKDPAAKKDEVQSAFLAQQLGLKKEIAKSDMTIANIAAGRLESDGQHTAALKEWLQFDKEGQKLSGNKYEKDKLTLEALAKEADVKANIMKMDKQHSEFMIAAGIEQMKSAREIAAIRSTGEGAKYTSADDFSASDAAKKMLAYNPAKYAQEYAAKLKEDESNKSKTAASYLYSLDQQNKSIGRQIQLLGMTTQEQELQQQLWALEDQFKKSTVGMNEADLAYQEQKTAYLEQQAKVQDSLNQKRAIERDPYQQSILTLKNYADEASNLGRQISGAWTNAFKGMEDAIVSFTQTGTLKVTDMANSIIADLIRIAVRQSITGPLASMLGKGISAWMGGGSGATSDYGYALGSTSAKGNVFSAGNVTPFANGGAFTNGIATKPTLAPMALFGEAGEEAIMPLRRDASGRLGVASAGSNSVPNVQINYIDQTSEKKEVTTGKPAWNGDAWVLDVVVKAARNNQRFREAMGIS